MGTADRVEERTLFAPTGQEEGVVNGGRQAPLIALPGVTCCPGVPLCSIGTKPERPFDRRNSRGGGVVAPGGGTVDFRSSGRSVPPRFDFGHRKRRFGRLQTGFAELKRRS